MNKYSNDIDENGLTPSYLGSSIKFDSTKNSISKRLSKDSYTAYLSKMFTAFVSVEKCVGCNCKGGKDGHTGILKRKFSPIILSEIYKTIEYHFKDVITNKKEVYSKINNIINKKLGQINRHLKSLRIEIANAELTKNELNP